LIQFVSQGSYFSTNNILYINEHCLIVTHCTCMLPRFLHMIPTELPSIIKYCNAFDSVFPQIENNMICTAILPHFSYIGFHICKIYIISNVHLYPSKFCWIFFIYLNIKLRWTCFKPYSYFQVSIWKIDMYFQCASTLW